MTQPPPPSEVKKPNSRRNLWIALLAIIVVLGVIVGIFWWMGASNGYTRIKVVNGPTYNLTIGGTVYQFRLYISYFGGTLTLEVSAGRGSTDIAPIRHGEISQVLGLEIVASEVHGDYVILMVKSL